MRELERLRALRQDVGGGYFLVGRNPPVLGPLSPWLSFPISFTSRRTALATVPVALPTDGRVAHVALRQSEPSWVNLS